MDLKRHQSKGTETKAVLIITNDMCWPGQTSVRQVIGSSIGKCAC